MIHPIAITLLLLSLLSDAHSACPASYQAPYDLSQSPTLVAKSPTFTEGGGQYYIQPCGSLPIDYCPSVQDPANAPQQCFNTVTWGAVSDSLGMAANSVWSPFLDDWKFGAVSINKDLNQDYDLCNPDTATNNIQVTYYCGNGDDSVVVAQEPTVNKNGACIVSLMVDSSIVCGPKKKSFSGGWIFVIIVACSFSFYFLAGILFNRIIKSKTGFNMIPHVEFWRDLPSLVKEGCLYAIAKVKGVCGVKTTTGSAGAPASQYDEI